MLKQIAFFFIKSISLIKETMEKKPRVSLRLSSYNLLQNLL